MKTIVIDAGHGGSDSGNTGNGLVVKDYVLLISNYIANRLNDLNIPYFLTRTGDVNLSIDERVNSISTKYGTNNDIIVISNHLNKGNENGLEVIYQLKNSDRLYKKIYDEVERSGLSVNKYYQLRDSSNTSKDYEPLLRDTPNYETVMIEYGYVNNLSDANSLKNDYQKYGEAIVKALTEYTGNKYNPPTIDANTYTVQKGDTLYKIATKYGITVSELKSLNNLTSNIISLGRVLKVPQKNVYIVQKGDSLWKIATKYNITVSELKSLNNLTSDLLSIGQVLKIPSNNTYTVKSGDTLFKIANKYKISVDELKRANNLTSNILRVGQSLTIPS